MAEKNIDPKPAAEKGTKERRVQIQCTVTPDEHAALQEIRWTERVERISDLVNVAVLEYIARHKGN